MRNGYALPSQGALQEISLSLRATGESELDRPRELLRIGVQWSPEVTFAGAGHKVSQAYRSALPVAYSGLGLVSLGEGFARLVPEAAYEARMCMAILNSVRTGDNRLFLTLLGGGAFGNQPDWIVNSIRRALDLHRDARLDVVIISYGLVRELVTGAWMRFVRNIGENAPMLGEAPDLSEFIFGSGRAPLGVFRPILSEFQGGKCFYCARALRTAIDVDHFIPWSRCPVDLGHNFVLAHSACNGQKADRLAAIQHLDRWCERNAVHGKSLLLAFRERNVVHDLQASWRVTLWAYEQAERVGSQV